VTTGRGEGRRAVGRVAVAVGRGAKWRGSRKNKTKQNKTTPVVLVQAKAPMQTSKLDALFVLLSHELLGLSPRAACHVTPPHLRLPSSRPLPLSARRRTVRGRRRILAVGVRGSRSAASRSICGAGRGGVDYIAAFARQEDKIANNQVLGSGVFGAEPRRQGLARDPLRHLRHADHGPASLHPRPRISSRLPLLPVLPRPLTQARGTEAFSQTRQRRHRRHASFSGHDDNRGAGDESTSTVRGQGCVHGGVLQKFDDGKVRLGRAREFADVVPFVQDAHVADLAVLAEYLV